MTAVTEAAALEIDGSINRKLYSLTSVASGQTLATPFSTVMHILITPNSDDLPTMLGATASSGTITFYTDKTVSVFVEVWGYA